MVIFNNQVFSRIEGATNTLEQKVIDGLLSQCTRTSWDVDFHIWVIGIINWLTAQLAKQKKNDFKPKDDDLSFARVNTEPCIGCCEALDKVREAAKENLSGKNLEIFLTEVGVAFHR